MSQDFQPLKLTQATADLQLELGRLLLQSTQGQLELLQRRVERNLGEAKACMDSLQRPASGSLPAGLSADFWTDLAQRQWAQRQEEVEKITQNQASFATGMQQALMCWWQAATHSAAYSGALPAADWLKPWLALQTTSPATTQKD